MRLTITGAAGQLGRVAAEAVHAVSPDAELCSRGSEAGQRRQGADRARRGGRAAHPSRAVNVARRR
jgi:dihydrodipicolinate reductase